MFENRRMPNGMSERVRSRGHAVWEGVPCKGALYPIHRFTMSSTLSDLISRSIA